MSHFLSQKRSRARSGSKVDAVMIIDTVGVKHSRLRARAHATTSCCVWILRGPPDIRRWRRGLRLSLLRAVVEVVTRGPSFLSSNLLRDFALQLPVALLAPGMVHRARASLLVDLRGFAD